MKTRSNKAWLDRLRARREAREQKERDRIEFERREAIRRRKDREAWEAKTPEERDLSGRHRRRFGAYGLMAVSIMLGGRHL